MSIERDALWASGHDESVEVNQRALIDKVLARYSEEFTVFRELLQNSDDASARAVEIHFDTDTYLQRSKEGAGHLIDGTDFTSPLPDLKTAVVNQWTFKNDGIIFRDEDWNRLKKIAEGNPDEEKIGAFGVGFYSLFSVTEEPFVTSGGQWMGFYWKDGKDQLFARRGKLPETNAPDAGRWTTFVMPLRKPEPPPTPFDFIRFLTYSITFMAHLSEVRVYFDGKRLARLCKDRGVPRPIGLRHGLKSDSARGLMRVTAVSMMPLSIRAEVMQWVYAAGSSTKPRQRQPTLNLQARKGVSSGFFSSLFSSFGNTPRGPSPNPEPIQEEAGDKEQQADEQRKLLKVSETGVVLAVFSAQVDVRLDAALREELLRATKKNAPTKMKYELIYTGKDEYDTSRQEDEQALQTTGSIFQGLRADIDGTGSARIFIGHSTRQTTGIGGHMSARFIPTVERESVDLVDRNVRIWNEELLGIGGYLARTAYEQEMESISASWNAAEDKGPRGTDASKADSDAKKFLRERALHALKFYTFHTSTPSPQVSQLLEEAFFTCITPLPFTFLTSQHVPHQLPIISTVGVRGASDVRMPNSVFSEFLKQLPVIPDDVVDGAKVIVETLKNRGLIKEITFGDVLQELRARPLQETEIIACFKWWIGLQKTLTDAQTQRARAEIINAAILTQSDEKITTISSITTFLNTRSTGSAIPTDGPLPAHLLPLSISRHFDPQSLQAAFGWRELSVSEWLQYILDPQTVAADVQHDVTRSPQWAERVIHVLARVWPSSSKDAQSQIVAMLQDKTCVPTSAGLKVPADAYFQNAHVFPDLPLVTFPSGAAVKGNVEKVLQALGVRKHVELQIVFNRMIKTGDWSIADLTKYLVAVQATLTAEEVDRLRLTAAFLKEETPNQPTPTEKIVRYKASDLYEPLDVFRELGLPIIDWGTKTRWRSGSDEAKFLHRLGLRRSPPLEVILALAASPNVKIRESALKYFLDTHSANYVDYRPSNFSQLAFIPALKAGAPCMGRPGEVFSSPIWAAMGLLVTPTSIQPDAVGKLGIMEHPPTSMLVSILEKTPPENVQTARLWFSAMASRIADFSSKDLQTLSQLLIVPVETQATKVDDKGRHTVRLLAPSQCYFKKDAQAQVHSKLFTFVDFGIQANQFLSACGTKHEPTVEEIAQILLDNPHRFWELADSSTETYLIELRNIAVNRRLLSSGTIVRMKRTPVLLGIKRKKRSVKGSSAYDPEEDEGWDYEYDLLRPDRVIIADDTNGFQLFGDRIFTCPQEDLLEGFYGELGSRRLSSLVKEEYETTTEVKDARKATEIRARILERLPLFLHEHTHAPTRVPFSWLNADRNFVVRVFGTLTVKKALAYGEIRLVEKQDASAVARRDGRGPIQLWLASNIAVDMFEVSTSMCRLLFSAPKASDALLFMTILSTDLKALRRRGYDVDRILQKQKADARAAESAATEQAKQTALVSQSAPPGSAPRIPSDTRPESPPPSLMSAATETTLVDGVADKDKHRPPSMLRHLRRKIMGDSSPPQIPGGLPVDSPLPESTSGNTGLLTPPRSNPSRPVTPGPGVTPMASIETNINMAIKACKEEKSQLLQSKDQMKIVKESLNDSYCDVSGKKDLTLVGDMGGVKVFVARDILHPKEIFAAKRDSIARFIHVVKPLADVYELPSTSLHIFYDTSGGTIAFNRNASLFLNLRFFEAWHDDGVRAGELSKAYISWYFTLAHEIAHNLVQPHNAEHEFWFSSLCEARLPELTRLLASR